MNGRIAFGTLTIALACVCLPASAAPNPAPPTGSLAAALATARLPDTGAAIAVAADRILLPDGARPVEPGIPIGMIADAYGRVTRPFGAVHAIAPPTMTILNPDPAAANLYQDMPDSDVFRLLAMSLSPAQWQQLTGKQGLGIGDLDQTQQLMFKALFPDGLEIAPNSAESPDSLQALQKLIQTVPPARLDQARLRLSQKVRIGIPIVGAPREVQIGVPPPKPGDPPEYTAMPTGFLEKLLNKKKTLAGTTLREDVPNAPKPSELDYNAPRFRMMISLTGLNNVGDLVARIGRQTRTELYADARLETLPLSVVGADRAAPAADLLRALAFCVTGTFRNVGPAFVLTDDRVGVGTRRMTLLDFFDSVNWQRREALGPPDALALAHPIAGLPPRSDSLTIDPDQLKNRSDIKRADTGVDLYMPFEELTTDQQRAAESLFEELQKEEQQIMKSPAYAQHPSPIQRVTLDEKIELATAPSLQLQVPGLDGPIDMDSAVQEAFQSTAAQPTITVPPSQPPFPAILKRYQRRIALVRPRTLQELDSIITAMPGADLNELWIIAPGPGESSAAVNGQPPPPGAGALIDEALTRARPAHIRVLPVLDLFSWGAAAPTDALDYTLRGETSRQRQKRLAPELEHSQPGALPPETFKGTVVSPFAPPVETALDSLLKAVIRPGIEGIVWQENALPGYEPVDGPAGYGVHFPTGDYPDFGYTVTGRLRFLRQAHVDPVDIGPVEWKGMDLSLSFFNDPEQTRTLQSEWQKLRSGVDLDVLQHLQAITEHLAAGAAPANAPFTGLTVIVSAGENSPQFGSWDDPRVFPPVQNDNAAGTPALVAAAARRASRSTFLAIEDLDQVNLARLASELSTVPVRTGWDGLVFDLTPTDAQTHALLQSSLDRLNHLITTLFDQKAASRPAGE